MQQDATGKTLKSEERKAFMREHLVSKAAAPAEKKAGEATVDKKFAQRGRMKNCNMEASENELKGEARKKFMSGYLEG